MATTSSVNGTFSDGLTHLAMKGQFVINPLSGREMRREAERRRRREAKKAAKAWPLLAMRQNRKRRIATFTNQNYDYGNFWIPQGPAGAGSKDHAFRTPGLSSVPAVGCVDDG